MRSESPERAVGRRVPDSAVGPIRGGPARPERVVAPCEIDLLSVGAFEAAVLATDPAADLEVDMTGTLFCGSEALRVLIGALQRRRVSGTRVIVRGPRPNVNQLLEITGLDEILEVLPGRG